MRCACSHLINTAVYLAIHLLSNMVIQKVNFDNDQWSCVKLLTDQCSVSAPVGQDWC